MKILCAILLMLLPAVMPAVAAGLDRGATIVICADGAAVTVRATADGQPRPASAAHAGACPYCVLTPAVTLPPPGAMPAVPHATGRAAMPALAAIRHFPALPPRQARGPPVHRPS